MEKTQKNDFVEIKYTGYALGDIFDSNEEEELKKVNPKAKPEKTILIIGQRMVVSGLDKSLEDKEIGKEYKITFSPAEGFGERHRNLVQTIPIRVFHEQKVSPQAGMTFIADGRPVKILTVSGARVTADFNNPLAGKELTYKFTITRKITDEKEKVETALKATFRFIPEFELKDNTVTIKGQKNFEVFVNALKEKFKELMGKELKFEESAKKEEPKTA